MSNGDRARFIEWAKNEFTASALNEFRNGTGHERCCEIYSAYAAWRAAMDDRASYSWSGHNVHGDEESIKEISRLLAADHRLDHLQREIDTGLLVRPKIDQQPVGVVLGPSSSLENPSFYIRRAGERMLIEGMALYAEPLEAGDESAVWQARCRMDGRWLDWRDIDIHAYAAFNDPKRFEGREEERKNLQTRALAPTRTKKRSQRDESIEAKEVWLLQIFNCDSSPYEAGDFYFTGKTSLMFDDPISTQNVIEAKRFDSESVALDRSKELMSKAGIWNPVKFRVFDHTKLVRA